jgi:hypothetical protein
MKVSFFYPWHFTELKRWRVKEPDRFYLNYDTRGHVDIKIVCTAFLLQSEYLYTP